MKKLQGIVSDLTIINGKTIREWDIDLNSENEEIVKKAEKTLSEAGNYCYYTDIGTNLIRV